MLCHEDKGFFAFLCVSAWRQQHLNLEWPSLVVYYLAWCWWRVGGCEHSLSSDLRPRPRPSCTECCRGRPGRRTGRRRRRRRSPRYSLRSVWTWTWLSSSDLEQLCSFITEIITDLWQIFLSRHGGETGQWIDPSYKGSYFVKYYLVNFLGKLNFCDDFIAELRNFFPQ